MSGEDHQRQGLLHAALDRLRCRLPSLAAATVQAVRRHGDAPPAPAADGALRTIVHHAALWVLEAVDDRTDPAHIGEAGLLNRTHHSLTAPLVSQACNDMCRRTWQALVQEATAEEGQLLLERSARYLAASTELVEHVLTEQSAAAGSETRLREMATRLLNGERPPASLSAEGGTADTYAVLAVPTQRPGEIAGIAARHHWLSAEQPGAVTVLVPVGGPGRRADGRARARHAFHALCPQHPVGLGLPADVEGIPAAVADAWEAVATLRRLGRHEPGLFQLDDVLLEAMLCRAPELAARLAGRLRPVTRCQPYLLDTLAAFLDNDGDRRELARQLYIHPNTLNHRLRRVSELTGLSLANAGDLCLLKAALTAWQVTNAAAGAGTGRPAFRAA
uniref:SibX n=1 Tax=Streptosporangium sibiricum TaxID=457432 RepID=C0LTN8_STRSJ|nr:SibX [Streptosporangium sibiricum]